MNIKVYLKTPPLNKLEIHRRAKNILEFENLSNCGTLNSPSLGSHDFQLTQLMNEETHPYSVIGNDGGLVSTVLAGESCNITVHGNSNVDEVLFGNLDSIKQMANKFEDLGNSTVSNDENKTKKIASEIETGKIDVDDSDFFADKRLNKVENNDDVERHHKLGVLPKFVDDLFEKINEYSDADKFEIQVSARLIMFGTVYDLVNLSNSNNLNHNKSEATQAHIFHPTDAANFIVRVLSTRELLVNKRRFEISQSFQLFTFKISQPSKQTAEVNFILIPSRDHSPIYRTFDRALQSSIKSNKVPFNNRHDVKFNTSEHLLTEIFFGNKTSYLLLSCSRASTSAQSTLDFILFGRDLLKINDYTGTDTKNKVEPSNATWQERVMELLESGGSKETVIEYIKQSGCRESLRGVTLDAKDDECNHVPQSQSILHLQQQCQQIQLQNTYLQSELDILMENKRLTENQLVDAMNERTAITSKLLKCEQQLRVSRFREMEACYFLRQFRRYYRRVLKHKTHIGSELSDGLYKGIDYVPGIPNVDQMNDTDQVLVQMGLLEAADVASDDATIGSVHPSQEALLASSKVCNILSTRVTGGTSTLPSPGETSVEKPIATPPSPGSKSNTAVIDAYLNEHNNYHDSVLIQDLDAVNQRYVDLKISLDEALSVISKMENSNERNLCKESAALRTELERKTNDIQAVVWKMNEINTASNILIEKVQYERSYRENLEAELVAIQNEVSSSSAEKTHEEIKLRDELNQLRMLTDDILRPLLFVGDNVADKNKSATSINRVYIPLHGGKEVNSWEQFNVAPEKFIPSLPTGSDIEKMLWDGFHPLQIQQQSVVDGTEKNTSVANGDHLLALENHEKEDCKMDADVTSINKIAERMDEVGVAATLTIQDEEAIDNDDDVFCQDVLAKKNSNLDADCSNDETNEADENKSISDAGGKVEVNGSSVVEGEIYKRVGDGFDDRQHAASVDELTLLSQVDALFEHIGSSGSVQKGIEENISLSIAEKNDKQKSYVDDNGTNGEDTVAIKDCENVPNNVEYKAIDLPLTTNEVETGLYSAIKNYKQDLVTDVVEGIKNELANQGEPLNLMSLQEPVEQKSTTPPSLENDSLAETIVTDTQVPTQKPPHLSPARSPVQETQQVKYRPEEVSPSASSTDAEVQFPHKKDLNNKVASLVNIFETKQSPDKLQKLSVKPTPSGFTVKTSYSEDCPDDEKGRSLSPSKHRSKDVTLNQTKQASSSNSLFIGGRSGSYVPLKFTKKHGLSIKCASTKSA